MKKMIIILGTVILGAWIVSTLIMGSGDNSLKSQSNAIVTKANTEVTEMMKDLTWK